MNFIQVPLLLQSSYQAKGLHFITLTPWHGLHYIHHKLKFSPDISSIKLVLVLCVDTNQSRRTATKPENVHWSANYFHVLPVWVPLHVGSESLCVFVCVMEIERGCQWCVHRAKKRSLIGSKSEEERTTMKTTTCVLSVRRDVLYVVRFKRPTSGS